MTSTIRRLTISLVPLLLLAGCASDGPPVTDPGQGVSGRKHYGQENEISLYRLLRGRPAERQDGAEPVVGDAEYQEYQEWKRWREFKEYQKWKEEQGPTQSSTQTTGGS